jgi:hypothetical protein
VAVLDQFVELAASVHDAPSLDALSQLEHRLVPRRICTFTSFAGATAAACGGGN